MGPGLVLPASSAAGRLGIRPWADLTGREQSDLGRRGRGGSSGVRIGRPAVVRPPAKFRDASGVRAPDRLRLGNGRGGAEKQRSDGARARRPGFSRWSLCRVERPRMRNGPGGLDRGTGGSLVMASSAVSAIDGPSPKEGEQGKDSRRFRADDDGRWRGSGKWGPRAPRRRHRTWVGQCRGPKRSRRATNAV